MTLYTGPDLDHTDLIIDALYQGFATPKGGVVDPLVKLVGVSRQGGFRYRGSFKQPKLLVLTSNLAEPDWPDELDLSTGRFVYYGDNRHPGRHLHDTPRFGNQLLQYIFDQAHGVQRESVPPILIFTSESPGRTFRFRGLAVPGHHAIPSTEDLVAVWKTSGMERFQNYRAVFTILNEPVINREWVHAVGNGHGSSVPAPGAWKKWVDTGLADPLEAPKTQLVRSRVEQLPIDEYDIHLLGLIRSRYEHDTFGFEACAAAITRLLLGNVARLDLTRPWRDGGRDGIGTLVIGHASASIPVTFALEAKCYGIGNSVGVREVSRLISRIKHREFGVLVTTSYVDRQAYQEVVDDGHPVILVTAIDIINLLKRAGYSSPLQVNKWLDGISNVGFS